MNCRLPGTSISPCPRALTKSRWSNSKAPPNSGDGAVTEGEWDFVENLGFSAKFSSLTRFPKSTNTSRIVRELIKVEP